MTLSQPTESIDLPHQWCSASWADYVALRDAPLEAHMRLFFNQGKLWVEMGGEGINHASVSDLFTSLLFLWAIAHPEQMFSSLGRCLLEKPETQACAPDLVLDVGDGYPEWQSGQPRRIDLTQWRVPDLMGEISDTTLTDDLDEKKHLYAALKISEYWVVDIRGQRVFAFQLQGDGKYRECQYSQVLQGLPIVLLEQALEQLRQGTNTSAAASFAQRIAQLPHDATA